MIVSKPSFFQRETGLHAAVIELDALPDAIRPAAEDDHFAIVRRRGLVVRFVGGIQIRREGFEFGRAGIDAIVGGDDVVVR